MRSKAKKLTALLMAGLLSVGVLAGCGSGSSSASGAATSAGDGTEADKPDKISVMVDGTLFTQENGRAEFEKAWTALTGIQLEITQPDHTAYYDVVGQTFASGDWPDVIVLTAAAYPGYAAEGALWDMTDAWENSELKASGRVQDESVIDGMQIDGRLYGFPVRRGGGCVTYVKQSWLDNVNMQAPTNYEEYLAMLEAFTTGDPDGNGIDGDTYGVSAAGFVSTEVTMVNYLPEFYQDAFPGFYKNDNGEWVDGFTEDAMGEALLRMQYAYQKGYIDRETLTNATSDVRTKFYEDKFGVFSYWAGIWGSRLKLNLENNGLDGELVALEPIAEVGQYLERIPPVWCVTSACENPDGVFKYFIESILDGGDMQFLWQYGVEGVHWSTEAGEVLGTVYEEGEFHMLESMEVPGTQYDQNHFSSDTALALIDQREDPADKTLDQEAVNSLAVLNNNSRMTDLIVSTDVMMQYNGDLTSLKNELIAVVVTQGVTVEAAMARFEAEGGAEWSQAIVDSLNNG